MSRSDDMRHTVQAVIFDMDGLLIDSEPFWRESEVAVLSRLGVPITEEKCAQFAGLRIGEVVANWRRLHPWDGPDNSTVAKQVQERVCQLIRERGELLPGAGELVRRLHAEGWPLAVATSSAPEVVDAVMERTGIRDCFQVIASASAEEHGKPHPAVFLTAAKLLDVDAVHCLVLEDALLGVIAAKAARMQVVAVPEEMNRGDVRFQLADAVITSLTEFRQDAGHLLS